MRDQRAAVAEVEEEEPHLDMWLDGGASDADEDTAAPAQQGELPPCISLNP